MSKRIKVRFNLSAGKNYMKWKVEYPDKTPEYFDPAQVQLLMRGCQLRNQKTTARKIHQGANKTVCAWILCDRIYIKRDKADHLPVEVDMTQVKYNPRKHPFWFIGLDDDPVNVDMHSSNMVITDDRKLYAGVINK